MEAFKNYWKSRKMCLRGERLARGNPVIRLTPKCRVVFAPRGPAPKLRFGWKNHFVAITAAPDRRRGGGGGRSLIISALRLPLSYADSIALTLAGGIKWTVVALGAAGGDNQC